MRARPQSDDPSRALAWDGDVLRMTGPTAAPQDNGVVCSRLRDGPAADAAIARQLDHFGRLGHAFEWKLYEHDAPPDLALRLRARGFVGGEPETLVVLDLASSPSMDRAPAGVTLRRLDDPRDLAPIVDLNADVYGERAHATWLVQALEDEKRASPDSLLVHGAFAPDGLLVSAGWLRLPAGSAFGSLWGGATRAAWRGRGVYSAVVARRADDARARGYRWLAVDCGPHSLPILVRRGFRPLARATPWVWSPDAP